MKPNKKRQTKKEKLNLKLVFMSSLCILVYCFFILIY